ncbi:MAG TPA: hypothetical protein VEK79_12350 [Thermoanaerobaculia bacterium]|nr:hypothetical protein [Thermoanaerobaculia bacterium]
MLEARHPFIACAEEQVFEDRFGAGVFVGHAIGERAKRGDRGRNGFGTDRARIPHIIILERIRDHAERLDLVAAWFAGREVRVGMGAIRFEECDEGFVVVVPFDHRRTITSSARR